MTEIKKNHSLRRIRLMKRAAVIRQNNGMDKREALVVAHQIDVLIRKMYLASVSFYYTKQDGSIRHAVGTLTGYEHCFHRPYTPRPENTFVVYYDLEAKGWRTFHAENFLRATGTFINAGHYKVLLSADSMEGLAFDALDIQ